MMWLLKKFGYEALKSVGVYDDSLFKGKILLGNERFRKPRYDISGMIDYMILCPDIVRKHTINCME